MVRDRSAFSGGGRGFTGMKTDGRRTGLPFHGSSGALRTRHTFDTIRQCDQRDAIEMSARARLRPNLDERPSRPRFHPACVLLSRYHGRCVSREGRSLDFGRFLMILRLLCITALYSLWLICVLWLYKKK